MPPSKSRTKPRKAPTPKKAPNHTVVILPTDEQAFVERELLRKGGTKTQFVADLVKEARVKAATRPVNFIDAEVVAVQESPENSWRDRTTPADADVGVLTDEHGHIKSVEARSEKNPTFEPPPFKKLKDIPAPQDQLLPPKEQRETWRAFLTRISNEGTDYLLVLDNIARGKPHVNVLPPNAEGVIETYTVFPSLELRANVAAQLHTVLHGKAPNAERIQFAEEAAQKHKSIQDQRRRELEGNQLSEKTTEELFAEMDALKEKLLLEAGPAPEASPAPAPTPVEVAPQPLNPAPITTPAPQTASGMPQKAPPSPAELASAMRAAKQGGR